MEVQVRLPTGDALSVPVAADATVRDVKEAVQDAKGVPLVRQKISIGGKRATDKTVLAEAGISEGDEVKLHVTLNGGCNCCISLCKALLIILLFPFILLLMFIGLIFWIILSPCYCIGKCCCEPSCCCVVCVEEHVVDKMICLPCRACSWICEDVADA